MSCRVVRNRGMSYFGVWDFSIDFSILSYRVTARRSKKDANFTNGEAVWRPRGDSNPDLHRDNESCGVE